LTPDPYKSGRGSGDPLNPKSWNRYAYVEGDPVNANDPSGESKCGVAGFYEDTNGQWSEKLECHSDGGSLSDTITYQIPGIPAVLDMGDQTFIKQAQNDIGNNLDQTEWNATSAALYGAASKIAAGLGDDYWNNALYRIIDVNSNNPTKAGLTGAANAVTFSNGLTTSNIVVQQAFNDPTTYAQSLIPGNEIFWRPNVLGQNRQLNWLFGAVLHELLHNLGFFDPQIQAGLGVAIDPLDTDNISRALAEKCFK
jgi:hypothetical protein